MTTLDDVIDLAKSCSPPTPSQKKISAACMEVMEMLLAKNRKYGDSALNPVRIFSKASAYEQILVRLDDKLSRLRSQQADEDEDVISDLIGYLILLKISKQMVKAEDNG